MQLLNALGCILLAGCLSIDTVKALECHKCNSERDLDCAVNPSTDKLTKCGITDTQCFTLKLNGNIIRGCESEIPKECTDKKCGKKYCNYDRCNKDDPEPEPTLQCIKCSGGKDCALGLLLKPKLCENFAEQDECYTYVLDEEHVTRGCVSDNDSLCKNKEEFCFTCDWHGCNKDLAYTTFSCNECQGSNETCMGQSGDQDVCAVSSPKECNVLLGRKGGCFTYFKLNEFKRGCMRDYNEGNDRNYAEFCNEENCNSECVTNCYKCNSADEPTCKFKFDEFHKEPCFGTTHCHECENEEGVIIRGCGKNDDTSQTCEQCGDNMFCNKDTPNTCISCSSDRDKDCILITDESKPNTQQCDSIFDECISKIHKTLTVRGCTKQVEKCDDPDRDDCTSCNSDLCNKDLIPEDRIFCHQCNDTTDCAKKQKLESAAPCEYHHQIFDNECFSYKENDQVVRGCSRDEAQHEVCLNQGNSCLYCISSSGCNSEIAESTSKCIICEDKNECAWSQLADNAVECKFDFMEPSCFTQVIDNQITRRGCVNRTVCNDPRANCIKCSEEACNTKAVTTQTCIICDSAKDPNCVEANEIRPTNCTAKETYFNNRGCYTIREDEKIRRGCITELMDRDMKECNKENSMFCNLCTEQGCNKGSAPVGGTTFINCIQCGPNDQECSWGHSKESAKRCEFTSAHAACFSLQHENGVVIRGCSNDKSACDGTDEKCNICDEDACNNQNFVHQKCYQCVSNATNGATCANENPNKMFIEKCSPDLQIFEDRGCYTRTENKIVTRGCLMDLSANESATCKADEKKEKCDFCMEAECNNKKAPNSGSLLTHFSFVSLIIISALITVKNHLE